MSATETEEARISKRGRVNEGRPPVGLDLDELEKLCQLQCTDEELAAYFSCTTRTIENYRTKPEYREVMERGKAKGRVSLRRAQYRAAVEDSNPTMLVWLGKSLLGQKDTINAEIGGNGKPIATTTSIDLSHLSVEQLTALSGIAGSLNAAADQSDGD